MKLTLELTSVEYEYILIRLLNGQKKMISKPSINFIQGIIDKLEKAAENNASLRSGKREG